jgi:hypothetical protein
MNNFKKPSRAILMVRNACCLIFPLIVFSAGVWETFFNGDFSVGVLLLIWSAVMLVLIAIVAWQDSRNREKNPN